MQVENIMESFLKFENKYKMFTIKTNGVYFWHYIRFYIYNELLTIHGVKFLDKDSTIKKQEKTNWRNELTEFLKYSPFFAHQRDVLIIPHQRKYHDEGKYYKCIYTNLIEHSIKNSKYVLDQKSRENIFAVQKSQNILHFDLEIFNKLKRISYPVDLISKKYFDKVIIEPLEDYFNLCFSYEFKRKLIGIINNYLNERKYLLNYYNFILQKNQPKIILIVVSYGFDRMILCELAKMKKIPVVELQHGRIDSFHIAYNFYEKMNLLSFPDYVFTFGKVEKRLAKFPINKARIIPVGYPELEMNYKLNMKKHKEKKIILFISGGATEIAEYASIVAESLDEKKYQVIFQLHPKEYYNWKENIGKHLHSSRIEVRGSFENTIYKSLSEADWIVGNSSTVLYEAQMFDAKVAVLKIGLYLKELCQDGHALLIDSPKNLVEEIEKDSFYPNKENIYFEENSLENIQKNINIIINRWDNYRKNRRKE